MAAQLVRRADSDHRASDTGRPAEERALLFEAQSYQRMAPHFGDVVRGCDAVEAANKRRPPKPPRTLAPRPLARLRIEID